MTRFRQIANATGLLLALATWLVVHLIAVGAQRVVDTWRDQP